MDSFQEQGYFVAAESLKAEELETLRRTCDFLLDEPIDDGGNGKHRIGLGSRRRFLAHRHREFAAVESLVTVGSPAKAAAKILGSEFYLFNEQFVVKGPQTGAGFAWHQDGAYVGFDHSPYLSVWIALDDITLDNGCLKIVPRNLKKQSYLEEHTWDEDARELVGYSGSSPGISVTCAAGSLVLFSSLTLHSSGSNSTSHNRRAYLIQYSLEPIVDPETRELKRFGTPLGGLLEAN